jgi:hypothetical protein
MLSVCVCKLSVCVPYGTSGLCFVCHTCSMHVWCMAVSVAVTDQYFLIGALVM